MLVCLKKIVFIILTLSIICTISCYPEETAVDEKTQNLKNKTCTNIIKIILNKDYEGITKYFSNKITISDDEGGPGFTKNEMWGGFDKKEGALFFLFFETEKMIRDNITEYNKGQPYFKGDAVSIYDALLSSSSITENNVNNYIYLEIVIDNHKHYNSITIRIRKDTNKLDYIYYEPNFNLMLNHGYFAN